ncbi:MAG TPA: hypothetical protein VN947_03505 [Polyangia bacterium]|nr:hypothetical protein [Polyangia bacterium]
MSIKVAVSAFAHRGARRGAAMSFLVYSAVLTAALVLLAAWIAPEARFSDLEQMRMWAQMKPPYQTTLDPSLWTTLALSDVFALMALALAGFVLAPAMVAATVANERRQGTLDQLRTTPLSPLGHAAGMILGVPARLYLLCAGPLVLHVFAALAGASPVTTLVSSLAVLAAGTLASCALGLGVALAPRQESGGTLAALGVAALLGVFALTTAAFATDRHMVAWSYLHPAGALDAVMLAQHGLWRRMVVGPFGGSFESEGYRMALPLVPVASVLASLAFGAILLRAACRKLAAPERPLLSKRQAVALFAFAVATTVGPLVASDHLCDFDSNAAYGFSALLLPAIVAVGLFATPTFEAWALALRSGARPGWSSDDAPAHRAVWLMEVGWALAILALLGNHRMHGLASEEPLAMAWTALVALTLPIYFLFASTRYVTVAGRIAFGVAVAAHVLGQIIAIGVVRGSSVSGVAGTFVTLAGIAGLAVPSWTAWRQHVLKVRTLAR